jgi:hypothetical protein
MTKAWKRVLLEDDASNYPWAGQWADDVDYTPNNCVFNSGSSYICVAPNGVGTSVYEPGVTTDWEDYWDILVQKGDKGDKGETGENGSNGADGARWYSGTGVPANGDHVVGDWYINDANGDLYEKTGASAWTLRDNLTGPQGEQGLKGDTGTGITPETVGFTLTAGTTPKTLTVTEDATISGTPITLATKIDELAVAGTSNTDRDANTTNHGLLLKAVAPAAGLLSVPGIANGETAYALKALFDATNPAALGVAAPGTDIIAARRGHVHPMPSMGDILPYMAGHYLHLPTNAGWTSTLTGTGSAAMEPSRLYVYVQATATSSAMLSCPLQGMSEGIAAANINWDKAIVFQFGMMRTTSDSGTIGRIMLRVDAATGDPTGVCMGIKVSNLTLYGESYGSVLGDLDLSTTLTTGLVYGITIVLVPGVSISWYVNGALAGTQSTANKLPSGSASACYAVCSEVRTVTTANASLGLYHPQLWVAR